MGNKGQHSSSPERGGPGQQEYRGWQYDQETEGGTQPPPPIMPPSSGPTQPQQPPPPPDATLVLPPGHRLHTAQQLINYQEPIPDMGSSLGYGQGMEYQYFDTPQPSQPIAQLRQERLQQLREERMRRQQRRMSADITTTIPWKTKGLKQPPTDSPQSPQVGNVAGPLISGSLPPPSVGSPTPLVGLPAKGGGEISPLRSGKLPVVETPKELPKNLAPAAQPAQDTAMIQRLRIGKATMILTFAFIASRILGLLRTSMFAFVFGTSNTSDAYLQAFLVPDLIFNIVAGGALSSAFIPLFTKYMVGEKDEKTAWHIASSTLNLAIVIMGSLAIITMIFTPLLVPFYNPGVHDAHQLDLIASLTRIMLLQSIALGAGVIITAVLNAQQDFRLPAIGTVLYNVGLIIGLLPGIYFAIRGQRNDSIAVLAATWGVVLGALLQIGIQIPGLVKVGMRYSYKALDWRHPGVIQIGRQMIPRIVNAAMLYTSTFVDRGLILLLVVVVGTTGINGLITQYYQALQLVLLPIGVFGMSVSTAAFPTLAENVTKGRFDRVRNTILTTLRGILFMSIPSSVGMIVLGLPIIQVLLQHGRYSLNDAKSTVIPLAFFALGLTGLAAVEILTRAFYALRDSKTPVIISVGQFVFKIALSLLLINASVWGVQWGMGALAFSTSLAGLLEAVILFWLLHQRVGDLQVRDLSLYIGRLLLAALAMAVALLITSSLLDGLFTMIGGIPSLAWIDTLHSQTLGLPGTLVALVKLLIEILIGAFTYLRVARSLGIEEFGPVKRVLERLKLSWI